MRSLKININILKYNDVFKSFSRNVIFHNDIIKVRYQIKNKLKINKKIQFWKYTS